MVPTVKLNSIRDVRLGTLGFSIVAGKDDRGIDTEIILQTADAQNIAPQLLCCAAIEAGPSRPLPSTIIPGCHLPVMNWRTGRSTFNGEPILELDLPGNVTLRFQFPASGAQQCGQALIAEGIAAAPPAGAPLN